jgi:hypothetical protein
MPTFGRHEESADQLSSRRGRVSTWSARSVVPAADGDGERPRGRADWDSLSRPGFAKIALSLRVQPYGAEASILTAWCVAVTDP